MIFFLSRFFPPPPFLATHAFNAFNDFLFIKYFSPPLRLGNPCFEWFAPLPLPAPCFHSLCSQWFSFYRFFLPPFLATLAFNDFLFIKNFPPPFLGNPCFECFQWFSFFQIFFPFASSWQPMLWMICLPSPARALFLKPMFSMILFLWIFPPPPFLATYAFNDFLFINIFPSSWHPILSMMLFLSNFSPPPPAFLATHAFNDLPLPSWQPMLSMIFFLSKFPPPLATHAFNDFFSKFFPPPFLATHAFNAFYDFLFIKFFPPPSLQPRLWIIPPPSPCWQPMLWIIVSESDRIVSESVGDPPVLLCTTPAVRYSV